MAFFDTLNQPSRVPDVAMAKDQVRSNREKKKPKRDKSTKNGSDVAMAKDQVRSNREKKKPKRDKSTKNGTEASSPFAGMHSQVRPGTSYKKNQYSKKR
jgi:hypothetical protein